jgi:hypothetical protein
MLSPSQMLVILVLGGLMGFLGQGSRAVIGLKGMSDDAKTLGVSPNDLFQAMRLFISLVIGLLVGVAAALIYIMSGGTYMLDWHILLGFAAAGYAGTDFLETFISNYLAPTVQPTAKLAALQKTALLASAPPPTDQPGQREEAIMDSITQWLQADGKLPADQDADPEGTLNATYHFAGPPEVLNFLQGVSNNLIKRSYTYNYKKDIPLATKLFTSTVTAVAYQIGKNTAYTPGKTAAA